MGEVEPFLVTIVRSVLQCYLASDSDVLVKCAINKYCKAEYRRQTPKNRFYFASCFDESVWGQIPKADNHHFR